MISFQNTIQYYPTPDAMCEKMSKYIKRGRYRSILDPEAGKGNLFTHLDSYYYKLYACEISPDLQGILASKKIPVLADDFLTANLSGYNFDAIIMNPPFRNGAEHFLKAWQIVKNGGRVVCLLNAETIRNVNNSKRELVQNIIEDNNGDVEFYKDVFKNAENPADVECALIVIDKPEKKSNFDFLRDELDDEINSLTNPDSIPRVEGNTNTGLMIPPSKIETWVARYNKAKDSYVKVHKAHEEMNFFLPVSLTDGIMNNPACYSAFVDDLRSQCWQMVFNETQLANYMSGEMKKDFLEMQSLEATKTFTVKNIQQLIFTLVDNIDNIMKKSVEQIFDYFTNYYDENRHYVEGWKTNDKFKVNKKVILPRIIRDTWEGVAGRKGQVFELNWQAAEQLSDIEKALALMTGQRFEEISKKWQSEGYDGSYPHSSIYWVLKDVEDDSESRIRPTGKWYETEFFNVKYYKKGTMHLEFKDDYIWETFNITACGYKKWLGE